MTYLPDVNVWIALAADKHIYHSAARAWLAKVRDKQLAREGLNCFVLGPSV
jgi:predicted nucleic acid-binding protein